MIRYEEWLSFAGALQAQMEEFFRKTKYIEMEQVQMPDLVPSAETLYVRDQMEHFCHELEEAYYQVKRLNAKVMVCGKIHKGENGRFWLDNEELACGRSIEILYKEKYSLDDIEFWHAGHIAHNGYRYYFTADRNLELEGAFARIKHHL